MPAEAQYKQQEIPKKNQAGFSLIEILVAFVILAMALTVIFRIFSGGLRNVSLSQDYARAEMIAESQMSVIGSSEALLTGITTGEWGGRFSWERVIEPYHPWPQDKKLNAPIEAYWITVNVAWRHSSGNSQIALSSVRVKHTPKNKRRG